MALRFRQRSLVARLRDEGGQTFVEFAIVAPVLVFILFAMVEAGFWLQAKATLRDAARAAARQAALCRSVTSPTPTTMYNQIATSSLDTATVNANPPNIQYVSGSCTAGTEVIVTANFPFSFGSLTIIPGSWFPALTTKAVSTVE
jgi:Flp pilus assembly protein TadG